MKFVMQFIFICGFTFISVFSSAQEIMKHPRVVELEDSLKDGVTEYVRTRFPKIPFMVTVHVDPMRREFSRSVASQSESMPFFESEANEEMLDEWDNPQLPLKALINRVKRIQVSITVPSKLKEADVAELKEGIFRALHLTPARDQIEIARRDWATDDIPWFGVYLASSILAFFLLGFLLISRSSTNKLVNALMGAKSNTNSSPSSPSLIASPMTSDIERSSSGGQQNQELKFNDPLKLKELATRHISFLMNSNKFPNHQDIFSLDRIGKENPAKLGAILSEFPAVMQQKIFSFSYGMYWIEALNSPGFLDFDCLETLQIIIQNPREQDNLDWDHTILTVWRLGEARSTFLKNLSKDEAFAILAEMPKAIAVNEARRSFPGAWAAILDPEFKAPVVNPERAKEIRDLAIGILPLSDIEVVKQYRGERELLNYLLTVDPVEERDIYGASPSSSMIHSIRPPFFRLFDQPDEVLATFVPLIRIEQWSLALFNLPKPERSKIDSQLNDKQCFLLIEKFKAFDAHPPHHRFIGKAREFIGASLEKFLKDRESNAV